MRHTMARAIWACGLVLVLASPAGAADLTAASHITAVTVYSDRATVSREAQIDIPAGASTIVFDSLPMGLMGNSLRAEGSAAAAVILGALDSKLLNGPELVGGRERELTNQIRALNDRLDVYRAGQEANDARVAFLKKLGEQADSAANENFAHMDLKPEQWPAASATIFNELNEALKGGVSTKVALREVQEQIAALQKDLQQVRTGERSAFKVSVPVDAKAATRLTLRLSYQLPNATWRPIYDARLDTASGKLTLTQFGEVRQATGEDWTDAALTLSTAQPSTGATPPALETQWVDVEQPATVQKASDAADSLQMNEGVPGRARFAAKSLAAPMMMKAMQPPAPRPVEAQFQPAQIDAGGFVSEYHIPGTATVPADNTARKVLIGGVDSTRHGSGAGAPRP